MVVESLYGFFSARGVSAKVNMGLGMLIVVLFILFIKSQKDKWTQEEGRGSEESAIYFGVSMAALLIAYVPLYRSGKGLLLERAERVFSEGAGGSPAVDVKALHAKIGELSARR